MPAVALHADTSTLTAVANDYGYEEIFARQVEGIGRPGDVLVVLSTSGASGNLVGAVDVAGKQGITTVGLLGRGPVPSTNGATTCWLRRATAWRRCRSAT